MKFGLIVDEGEPLREGRVVEKMIVNRYKTIVEDVAIYDTEEFCQSDLNIMQGHANMNEGGEFPVYGNTHGRSYERLREWRKELLQNKGLPDDGSIFGYASKEVEVPERVVVIPAHKHTVSVNWDCWSDVFKTDDDDDDCHCCG